MNEEYHTRALEEAIAIPPHIFSTNIFRQRQLTPEELRVICPTFGWNTAEERGRIRRESTLGYALGRAIGRGIGQAIAGVFNDLLGYQDHHAKKP